MKRLKNNLDERQELELLRIEHYGMWFAFWALLIVMVVQAWMGAPMAQIAGEWIVFMILCIGQVIACVRKGIWDRRLRPNFKTNLLISLIAAFAVAAFISVRMWLNMSGDPDLLWTIPFGALMAGAFTFVLCLAALTLTSHLTKKREQKLEAALYEDAEDE
ncbi:MAG: hypothetical protein Q4P20_04500 [Eubacteriales bacterium]|nr:hypothetical protein [Eubacteriales bacterium]